MSFFHSSISFKDKILFYESIANLLDGGVSLIASLQSFSERIGKGVFQNTIQNILFFIQSGDSLSIAMRKLPDFFSTKEIAIIEAGEQTGMLKNVFLSISEDLRREEELKKKVGNAMTYPIIILFFLILSMAIVMMYVIPQILPIIQNAGGEIGWSTKSLVWTSNFLRDNIILLLIFFIGSGLLINGYAHTNRGTRFFDTQKLLFPGISGLYRSYIIVQVMSTFHLLVGSGVSIVQTLKLTGASSGNVIIHDMYTRIAESVARGEKMSASFANIDPERKLFSLDILQMIESAEKTSTIAQVSGKISEQYRREVDAALASLVKYIEPIALLLAGGFVLWFAIAIFSAIMKVVSIAGV